MPEKFTTVAMPLRNGENDNFAVDPEGFFSCFDCTVHIVISTVPIKRRIYEICKTQIANFVKGAAMRTNPESYAEICELHCTRTFRAPLKSFAENLSR